MVLGRYPQYEQLAKALGARYFNVPVDVWRTMSDEAKWQANQKFLDRAIARGAVICLATPPGEAPPTGFYAKELEYLRSKGYS